MPAECPDLTVTPADDEEPPDDDGDRAPEGGFSLNSRGRIALGATVGAVAGLAPAFIRR